MHQYLYKYLALNKELFIPGIGSFRVETEPAKLNFVDRTVQSALPVIHFAMENHGSENDFCHFLSGEMDIDESDAAGKFTEFSGALKNSLDKEGSVALPGMGILTLQSGGTCFFNPQENIQAFFPSLNAERIIRKNTGHSVKIGDKEKTSVQIQEELLLDKEINKDRWWIYAVALAVIGVASIVIYKVMH